MALGGFCNSAELFIGFTRENERRFVENLRKKVKEI
jgi:hypothetical protein